MVMDTQPINYDALLKLTGQNHELAKELLTMFAAELPEMRENINRYSSSQDYKRLIAVIHKLHGSCCYCAATKLQQLSKNTETELKEASYGDIPDLISQIENEIMAVIEYIDSSKVS